MAHTFPPPVPLLPGSALAGGDPEARRLPALEGQEGLAKANERRARGVLSAWAARLDPSPHNRAGGGAWARRGEYKAKRLGVAKEQLKSSFLGDIAEKANRLPRALVKADDFSAVSTAEERSTRFERRGNCGDRVMPAVDRDAVQSGAFLDFGFGRRSGSEFARVACGKGFCEDQSVVGSKEGTSLQWNCRATDARLAPRAVLCP